MLHDTKAKILSAFWLALLALCGSGGCSSTHHVRWNPRYTPGQCRQRPRPVYVAVPAPVPYGYFETCWHPWPGQCDGYPTGAIDVEAGAAMQGGGAVTAPVERLPAVSDPADWEVLPVPEEDSAVGDPGANPMPQDDHNGGELVPSGGLEVPFDDDGTEVPPATEDQGTRKDSNRKASLWIQSGPKAEVTLHVADRPLKLPSRRDVLVQPATFRQWQPPVSGRGIVQATAAVRPPETAPASVSRAASKETPAQQRATAMPEESEPVSDVRRDDAERPKTMAGKPPKRKRPHFLSR